MELLRYVLMGFAPGLFWLWYFRRQDDLEPEPRWALARTFLLGCAAAGAVLLFRPFLEPLIPREEGWRPILVDAFFVTAAPEEFAKLLAFVFGAMLFADLDEPLDGILYGIAAALGFASVENVLYLLGTGSAKVLVLRAFTATLGHVTFGGLMGLALGLAKLGRGGPPAALLAAGYLIPVALHGLYDVFLFPRDGHLGLISLLGLLPLSLVVLGAGIRWARRRSPEYHPELAARRLGRRRRRR